MFALENTYTTMLDFGGINSGDAEAAISRASKGGMVSARELRGLVTLLEGVCVCVCVCVCAGRERDKGAWACTAAWQRAAAASAARPLARAHSCRTAARCVAPRPAALAGRAGADRLKRQIALTVRQQRLPGGPAGPLGPLAAATAALAVPKALMGAITAAVMEDASVADSASEQVRECVCVRARVCVPVCMCVNVC
jgi:hypothetical protein